MSRSTWLLLVVLLLSFAYLDIGQAGLVYESRQYLQPVPDDWRYTWTWIPRDLTLWSLTLQQGLGHGPIGFHLVNLGLHGLCAALVGALARRLGLSRDGALFAAALFLLHPLAVETVLYVTSRSEQFAAIGVLSACLLATGSVWLWPLIPVALGLGILGKESAIVGFGLVPLAWAYRTPGTWTRALTVTGSLAFIPLGMYWYGGFVPMVNAFESPGVSVDWWTWLTTQATAALRLFTLFILPIGQTIDYDYDLIQPVWRTVAACVLVLAFVAIWRRTRLQDDRLHPLIAFGVTFAVLAILPRLVIQTPRSYLNEHQVYLGLAGPAISGAALAWAHRV